MLSFQSTPSGPNGERQVSHNILDHSLFHGELELKFFLLMVKFQVVKLSASGRRGCLRSLSKVFRARYTDSCNVGKRWHDMGCGRLSTSRSWGSRWSWQSIGKRNKCQIVCLLFRKSETDVKNRPRYRATWRTPSTGSKFGSCVESLWIPRPFYVTRQTTNTQQIKWTRDSIHLDRNRVGIGSFWDKWVENLFCVFRD